MSVLVCRRASEELDACGSVQSQFTAVILHRGLLYSLLKQVQGNCQTGDDTMGILTSQQSVICCLIFFF